MHQKYQNGLPLNRQESEWTQLGIPLSRATLANWIIYCAENYLCHVYDYFHRQLRMRKYLMADETRVQVLNEPERNPETDSWMWLFRSGEDGLPPILLYHYTETRAKFHAASFLHGFHGYLETDGYQGYNNLPDIKRCSCWAHVRRYFTDAIPKGKEYDCLLYTSIIVILASVVFYKQIPCQPQSLPASLNLLCNRICALYSTVTDFARFLGLSTSSPFATLT